MNMKNNKIAIMTWHNYNNYGGILQAYALKSKIQEINNNAKVDMLDYIPLPPNKKRKFIFKSIVVKIINKNKRTIRFKKRKRR